MDFRSRPEKLKAILDMPNPNNQQELRVFSGIVNYYDRFTPSLASKCANLNDLLHKQSVWQWDTQHTASVQEIKKLSLIMIQAFLSIYPVMPAQWVLVLSFFTSYLTRQKVIAYASHKLSQAEKNYVQIQRRY